MRLLFFILLLLFGNINSQAKTLLPKYSTAGYYAIEGSPRQVFNMNVAWRFFKGVPTADPTSINFDDKAWDVVSLPHGLEYLPVEASGCVNYQGEVWYRKHFQCSDVDKSPKTFLYFEAIMGKCLLVGSYSHEYGIT